MTIMDENRVFRWISAGVSNIGTVRKINEDAYLDRPDKGIWVVADGMGGHQAGDVASQMIVSALNEIEAGIRLSQFIDNTEDQLLDVNRKLIELASDAESDQLIGSTVAALLAFGRHCAVLWAGDSRIYRFRDGWLDQLTQDHSHVEELIQQGLLLREDAKYHPSANVITRAIGVSEDLVLDITLDELRDGDRYLLCSDGLDKEVENNELVSLISRGGCAEACTAMIDLALERGARDNVTVIVINIEQMT